MMIHRKYAVIPNLEIAVVASARSFVSTYSWYALFFLALLGHPLVLVSSVLDDSRTPGEKTWYTRYPFYPPYCASPDEMEKRKLPALQKDNRLGETRLRHVTAVLRHGARTPYKAGLNCWDGYDTNPETSVWNCNLTAYIAAPSPEEISVEEGGSNNHDQAMFMFEKRYDALTDPKNNLDNHLKGTCQLGQLLLQGYEQEYTNGLYLRDAYVYDETAYNHDARLRLLDVSTTKANPWDDVYYRVDDESRTLLSGQVVLRGLFGPELDAYFRKNKRYARIQLHTADYDRDVLYPNHDVCPRLSEIWERNAKSPGYQELNASDEASLLRQFQVDVLKTPDPSRDMDAIDCMMTTMCTDRPLPDAINDYRPTDNSSGKNITTNWSATYGNDIFQRLHDFDALTYNYIVTANEAEYAKLAMQPLWYEIMMKIYPHIQGQSIGLNKLAVFTGHDTTIIPLLASLGVWNDTVWPPYASMVIIELHEMNVDGNSNRKIFSSKFAFRLIYNGEVITSKVSSCEPDLELCDTDVLVNALLQEHDCTRQYNEAVPYKDAVARTKDIVSTSDGLMYFLLVVGTSAGIGGMLVYVYLVKCFPKQYYSRTLDDDDGVENFDNHYRDRNNECRTASAPVMEIS
jgi:Histidine phosphatase superfamily (branch 2)